MAFYGVEPFGDEWRQTGTIAAASRSPYTKKAEDPSDFFPFRPRKPAQTVAEQIAVLQQIAARVGK